ncbi:hypothetical protein [Xanthobacter versatilis]|uniref:hypothetical protein n=1 Tax=Xanthobacter autotrophicus (strain ATCC BAA-1158 / Py2) TaxID=78245 RepID=UPI00372A7D92
MDVSLLAAVDCCRGGFGTDRTLAGASHAAVGLWPEVVGELTTMRARSVGVALSLLLLSGLAHIAAAAPGGDSRVVGDVQIYMGILPAELIRGHPQGHTENSMHGGQPATRGEFHIVVALFDVRSGRRLTGADVSARVSEIGLAGSQKTLNPMQIAGTESYGNYFEMPGSGPFRISLTIRLRDRTQDIKAEFEERHK